MRPLQHVHMPLPHFFLMKLEKVSPGFLEPSQNFPHVFSQAEANSRLCKMILSLRITACEGLTLKLVKGKKLCNYISRLHRGP